MKPYYEEAGITIYHGPNVDLLCWIDKEWAIITDPPYGIGYIHGAINIPNATKFAGKKVIGDDREFDPSLILTFPKVLMWGANHYAHRLPVPEGRWLVWDKRCGVVPERDTSDCEMAWVRGSKGNCARMYRLYWDGFNKQTERGQERFHPTQKPVSLMTWCLGFLDAPKIIDPYMGSGSTLVAAKAAGRQAIGMDVDEAYCEIAANRLRQSVFNFEVGA